MKNVIVKYSDTHVRYNAGGLTGPYLTFAFLNCHVDLFLFNWRTKENLRVFTVTVS